MGENTDELAAKLDGWAAYATPYKANDLREAAAALRASKAEGEALREALRPFAGVADKVSPRAKDDDCWCGQDGAVIRYRDLRRARALTALTQPEAPDHCHADRDGDCGWIKCPQLVEGEPARSGRHCPLDWESPEHG